MISSLRKRRAARRAGKEQRQARENGDLELTIPNHFRCPISLDLMKDPVTLSTGITYDRESIEKWIESGNVSCPITNQVLRSLEPIPNHTIRSMIQDWCVDNSSYGIERIPTPRIPVSSMEVSDILSSISSACKKEDGDGCRELVTKIKTLCKESERNRKCIVSNETGRVLCEVFEVFSLRTGQNTVLKEILSTLTMVLPLDGEARSRFGSASSLHSMVWFLRNGDLSERRNAVLLIKEAVSVSDGRKAEVLLKIEGAMEALFKLIKEPICPAATKASLFILYSMIKSSSPASASEEIISRFADMGLVSLLLETLVEAERSISERALVVLDGLCNGEDGRKEAYNNALTMPVLVKKILRVSDLATDVSVSTLWKLCKNEKRENDGVLVEAVQVGAFQKLLLMLQVGCGERTKEKVTELLKLLNQYRDRLECIDSMDFKNLKRPF